MIIRLSNIYRCSWLDKQFQYMLHLLIVEHLLRCPEHFIYVSEYMYHILCMFVCVTPSRRWTQKVLVWVVVKFWTQTVLVWVYVRLDLKSWSLSAIDFEKLVWLPANLYMVCNVLLFLSKYTILWNNVRILLTQIQVKCSLWFDNT